MKIKSKRSIIVGANISVYDLQTECGHFIAEGVVVSNSQICQALDGSKWDLNNKPIDGTTIPWRGAPPAHPGCRSILNPIVKSWSELNRNPAIAKKLKKAEAKIKPSTRANIDGKPVLATTNYEQWLKKQSKTRQLEVLGPTKYKLWKAKKLGLTDMIDQSHRPLTVDELIRKYE